MIYKELLKIGSDLILVTGFILTLYIKKSGGSFIKIIKITALTHWAHCQVLC